MTASIIKYGYLFCIYIIFIAKYVINNLQIYFLLLVCVDLIYFMWGFKNFLLSKDIEQEQKLRSSG